MDAKILIFWNYEFHINLGFPIYWNLAFPSMFWIKITKICIYMLKRLKICTYMHLFQKYPKYAFAYASMQMHNYPDPSYNRDRQNRVLLYK